MENKVTNDIADLREHLLGLAGRVEDHLEKAFQSFTNSDVALSKEVRREDSIINEMELDIEAECLKILALDHPVATELRFVLSVMRINTHLERIADLAAGVAKRGAKVIQAQELLNIPEAIPRMMNATTKMVHQAIRSLALGDTGIAQEVRDADDYVDDLRKEVLDWAQANASTFTATSISFITIATKIERVADLATNIAEDVIFAIDGSIVRHT
tara:strand:+ start:350 stop:994 length:645 start_codon:yes stop_codon:yes gene_type:complete